MGQKKGGSRLVFCNTESVLLHLGFLGNAGRDRARLGLVEILTYIKVNVDVTWVQAWAYSLISVVAIFAPWRTPIRSSHVPGM